MHILMGLALAGAAGWNAFLPLIVLVFANRLSPRGDIPAPYRALSNPFVIGALLLVLSVEIFADKIPGIDAKNDRAGAVYRPLAGAVLMAVATADMVLPGVVAAVIGAAVAFGTHLLKVRYRRRVGRVLAGLGHPVASMAEDATSAFVSVLAVLLPAVGFALAVAFTALTAWIGGSARDRQGQAQE